MRKLNDMDVQFNGPGPDPELSPDAPLRPKIMAVTAYTIVAGDHLKELLFPCTADTVVTIPNDATLAFTGTMHLRVTREGFSSLTFATQAGVTLDLDPEVAAPARLAYPDSMAILTRTAPNVWRISARLIRSDD